ncbi:MAG: TIR domain-containing protein [bacterium]|nr:TIR domain-containing protein [bacterium]
MARYQVFLSYINQDAEVMWRVYNDLHYEGISVWIDQNNLPPGTPAWFRLIQNAIHNCGCFVVLWSPESVNSDWVCEELYYAKAQGKQIYPLMVAGDPQTAVPFGFSTAQYTDVRGDRYADGIQKLVRSICDYLNIESRTQAHERAQREQSLSDAIRTQIEQIERARHFVQKMAQQRHQVTEQIRMLQQEEQRLHDRIETIRLEQQNLLEHHKMVSLKEKQAAARHNDLSLELQDMVKEQLELRRQNGIPPTDYVSDSLNAELSDFASLSLYDDDETVLDWEPVDPQQHAPTPIIDPTQMQTRPLTPPFPELPPPSADDKSARKRKG